MTELLAEEIYWDPYDQGFVLEPWPLFKRIREEAPVYYNEKHDFYAVSRAEDVEWALNDPVRLSSARGNVLEIIKSGMELPPGTLIMEDPPIHTLHRNLLKRIFTPRRIMALEPKIRAYAVECLEPLVGQDRFDLIDALGREMPMKVIGMMLGVPESDQVSIRDEVDDRLRTKDGGQMEFEGDSPLVTLDVFTNYIDYRIKTPGDDVMSDLVNTEFEDENGVVRTLTRDEAVMYATVVAGAGNETTGRLIGWLGDLLDRHPDQRERLVADASLIPGAIEETLRYEPASVAVARYATEDLHLHGVTVPQGSAVMVLLGAGNRDPERFPEPDSFDVGRRGRPAFTFGLGHHFCLGAALARMEGTIALEEILRRWPAWEVDRDAAKLAETATVRGWEKLPLRV